MPHNTILYTVLRQSKKRITTALFPAHCCEELKPHFETLRCAKFTLQLLISTGFKALPIPGLLPHCPLSIISSIQQIHLVLLLQTYGYMDCSSTDQTYLLYCMLDCVSNFFFISVKSLQQLKMENNFLLFSASLCPKLSSLFTSLYCKVSPYCLLNRLAQPSLCKTTFSISFTELFKSASSITFFQ